MLAVPFSIIGALIGHIVLGLTPSYLSVFGLLALAGISINDTLVMVDYVNRHRNAGASMQVAALESGAKRFRPIMLTSVTTFAGMMPLMFDRSLQAQFLIPMAVSLAFGVMFASAVSLYLVPCALIVGEDARNFFTPLWKWFIRPFTSANSVEHNLGSTYSD